MSNFIKVKDNTWINIDCITSIEYYPDGDGVCNYMNAYYLIICTNGIDGIYTYDDKSEALDVIAKLKQHEIILE